MLTVAPRGMEKEDSRGETPIFSVQKFMVNGMAALLLPMEMATGTKPPIFFRKGTGEIFPIRIMTTE